MSDILRIPGSSAGRSRAVAHGNLVWAVAVAPDKGFDMAAQTRATLAIIEEGLRAAGSGKHRILSATVYISDMNAKAEMDAEWTKWIPDGAWPQRACVEVGLSPGTLVEIAVVAARGE